jgi:16S rRNA G966 N2-methylase RsmD
VTDGYAIIRAGMEEIVTRLAGERFDLILLDPPYDARNLAAFVEQSSVLLAEDGMIVLEHAKRTAVPPRAGTVEQDRVLISGDSALTFYVPARAHGI